MNLSPTMRALVDYMRSHGNAIHRHLGGFWAREDWTLHRGESFGTTSIEALVKRGVAQYTIWQQNRRGTSRFPIKAELTAPDSSDG